MLRNTTTAKCPYCHRRTANPKAHLAESERCRLAHRELEEGILRAAIQKHVGLHGYQVGNIVVVAGPGVIVTEAMGVPVIVEENLPRGSFAVMARDVYEQGKRYREEAEKKGGR